MQHRARKELQQARNQKQEAYIFMNDSHVEDQKFTKIEQQLKSASTSANAIPPTQKEYQIRFTLLQVKNIEQWRRSLEGAIYFSLTRLKQFHGLLKERGNFKKRQEMIEKYEKILLADGDNLSLFLYPGGLFMIDEYDSVVTDMSYTEEQREFSKQAIIRVMSRFKSTRCILAGVFHPYTIGFYKQSTNSYCHYSQVIKPNDIAFTKKEVKENYFSKIKTAIQKLSQSSRESLISEIKMHLKFNSTNQAMIDHNLGKINEISDICQTKKMNEQFQEEKLPEYVIELMFLIHSRFNLSSSQKIDPTQPIISPSVAVLNILRLKNDQSYFFKQNDYINEAGRPQVASLFRLDQYAKLKPEAKRVLRQIIIFGQIQVPQEILYQGNSSFLTLNPVSALFQEGLLCVSKTIKKQKGSQVVLKVPNQGVKQYLLELYDDVAGLQKNFIKGFLDLKTKYEERKEIVQSLLRETLDEVRAYAISQLQPDEELTERYFAIYFINYFQMFFELSRFGTERPQFTRVRVKMVQTREQEDSSGKDQGTRNESLLSEITVLGNGYRKVSLIQIYRNKKSKGRHEKKVKKYDYVNGEQIGWVVEVGYDDQFKNIISFQIYSPEYLQEKRKADDEEKDRK